MKEDLLTVWVAFIEAIARFWNNRFHKGSEEISWLRHQLEIEKASYKELIDKISQPQVPYQAMLLTEEDMKPIGKPIIPWHMKRSQLERASREAAKTRAEDLEREAQIAVERTKSTEELEKEMGIS